MQTFNVFVYGTLMRGFRSNRFIPADAEMMEGKIVGNLYHFISGYPIANILRHPQSITGSGDYKEDMALQDDRNRVEPECLPFNLKYGRIHGELYKIPYNEEVIASLDSYEGFEPDSNYCLYLRTLVPVQTKDSIIWAWVYNMDKIPAHSIQILSGDWKDCFYSNRGGLRPEIAREIEKKAHKEDPFYL